MCPCLPRSSFHHWGENICIKMTIKVLQLSRQRTDGFSKLWWGTAIQWDQNQVGVNEKDFGMGGLQFSLKGAGFELNEKGILGERKDNSSNMESSVGIAFQMRGSCINKFLLLWLESNVECILRKTWVMNGYGLCKFVKPSLYYRRTFQMCVWGMIVM